MARGIHRLTSLQVQRARRRWLCDGGGLYLQQGRSWIFRYKRGDRTRMMGLGPCHTISLARARELARSARQQLHAGLDPLAARATSRAVSRSMTFQQCADAYIAAHAAGWRNPKHVQQWTSTLATYAGPVIGKLPVDAVDTGLVMQVLQPIWTAKPETASRLRGRIEQVLGWAAINGYRTGDNPARWNGHLQHLLPAKSKVRTVQHHAALPYAELPAFMTALRQQEGVAARALEFLILTGVRCGDIIGGGRDDAPPMRWRDIDLTAKRWSIPKTKTGAAHRVPLAAAALAVLDQMRPLADDSDIVFGGLRRGQPLSNGALLRLLDRMGADITAHGFRATFKTWATERTSYAREVVEAALSHTIPDELERAYRRGDLFEKRIRLMADWAAYCGAPETTATVLPLRAAASDS
jgi:integrase